MTPIADMVREMIARGVDPDVIWLAVSAAEQAVAMNNIPRNSAEDEIKKRREKDRLRKQNSAEFQGNPRKSAEDSLSKSLSLEKRESQQPEFRGNWRPKDADWDDAVAKLGQQQAESELVKFRERYRPRSKPGGDMDSEWRVWVQHAVDYLAGKGKLPAKSAAGNGVDLVEDEKFWDSACLSWKKFGKWSAQHCGPDPDSAACRCPPEILHKHGLRQGAV